MDHGPASGAFLGIGVPKLAYASVWMVSDSRLGAELWQISLCSGHCAVSL